MPSLTLACCIVGALLYLTDKSCSIYCEVCRRYTEECAGPKKECLPYLDSCATFQSTNYDSKQKRAYVASWEGGAEVSISRKTCFQANSCYENVTTVDLGIRGIISTRMSCCAGIECSQPLLPFPTVNRTLNGKKCKACFDGKKASCLLEEDVACKGDQTYCVELAGQTDWGGFGTFDVHGFMSSWIYFAMKGCVNPAFCELFHEGSVYFSSFVLLGDGSCTPASKSTTVSSHQVAFFFQVFVGFLLLAIYA
ncbi:phospholipase A2 inhibitor NAI-like [Erythrolamprus reginae]|uniref:phospholipase A2 inhibitor NAI-like n=1 Tax=Erythrolamprus reginae TaxID=121349 RepID=UPI00396C811E